MEIFDGQSYELCDLYCGCARYMMTECVTNFVGIQFGSIECSPHPSSFCVFCCQRFRSLLRFRRPSLLATAGGPRGRGRAFRRHWVPVSSSTIPPKGGKRNRKLTSLNWQGKERCGSLRSCRSTAKLCRLWKRSSTNY